MWFNLVTNPAQTVYAGGRTNVSANTNSGTTLPVRTNPNGQNGITCYDCVNGAVQGRSYQNLSVCPQGETTDPNPCFTTGGNVSCNSCQNGVPVGVGMFPIGQCPSGSSTDHNPCRSNSTSSVTCYDCVNGVSQGRSYMNMSVCPAGETTNENPCSVLEDDCYDCNSETMNRVPRGTCPDGQLISQVNSKGNSTNPCPIQVQGCMDSTADNFNSLATVSDESCTFEDTEALADEVEDLVSENQTAGLGDNKMIMYLAFGVIAYLLIKDK